MSVLAPTIGPQPPEITQMVTVLRAGTTEERAVLVNLQEEDRVPAARVESFQADLVSRLTAGGAPLTAIGQAAAAHGRCLQAQPPTEHRLAGTWKTVVSLDALKRYGFVADDFDDADPPPRLRLRRRVGTDHAGSVRSLWSARPVVGDADRTRDRLGLARMAAAGVVLYGVDLPIDATRPAWVPTVMDAGTYPAWRRPPSGHRESWGVSRNLTDDTPAEPEIIVLPAPSDSRTARLIGTTTTLAPQGYLVHRVP